MNRKSRKLNVFIKIDTMDGHLHNRTPAYLFEVVNGHDAEAVNNHGRIPYRKSTQLAELIRQFLQKGIK
jgi:hypothetical protein